MMYHLKHKGFTYNCDGWWQKDNLLAKPFSSRNWIIYKKSSQGCHQIVLEIDNYDYDIMDKFLKHNEREQKLKRILK